MRSLAELRFQLSQPGTTAIVMGPFGPAAAVEVWLRREGFANATSVDVSPSDGAFDRVIDLRVGNQTVLEQWFDEIFPGSPLARQLAPAAILIEEAGDRGIVSPLDPLLSRLPSYLRFEDRLLNEGGRRFLDFARVLALTYPRPVQVGDEWAQLASRLGAGAWSIADLTVLLRDVGYAFAIVLDDGGNDVAAFSDPFIVRIVASRVKLSTSEHYAMFGALRDMAVQSLLRDDAGDRFVKTELPLQARAGDAIEEYYDDGMALLASDPKVIVEVAETASTITQGSKLVLRAAHRLGADDTLSQLELAARRGGMLRLADDIAQGAPARPWRPIWATSQPVNTNRVVFFESSNVVCLAPDPFDPEVCFAGLANGTVWRVSQGEDQRLVWSQGDSPSEIRAIASLAIGGERMLFTAHSDQGVRAIDVESGALLWVQRSIMDGPLSAVAAAATDDGGTVFAGGVDGKLAVLDAVTKRERVDAIDLGAEIRAIEIVGDVVVVCMVNGEAAAVDWARRLVLWRVMVAGDRVCNAMSTTTTPEGFVAIIGTTEGELFVAESEDVLHEPSVRLLKQLEPGSASAQLVTTKPQVNAVRIAWMDEALTVVAGLSDASWVKWRQADGHWGQYLGHVGSVNAILLHEGSRVTTASGEGTVRSWLPRFVDSESATLEWGIRHRGPVTGITIDLATSHGEVTLVTGGADGTLRAWAGPTDTTGVRISENDSVPVRALLWDPRREAAFVGYADGVLRSVTRTERGWETVLVGIQHDGVRCLALSPTGRLYSAGVDGTVTRWHSDLSQGIAELPRQISEFGYLAAIHWVDGQVAVGGQDCKVHLLNAATLKPSLAIDVGELTGLAASSITCLVGYGGDLFVGLTTGHVVTLRDVGRPATSTEVRRPHDGEVRGIQAFELGGNLVIATTGLDRQVVLTDLRTGNDLAAIPLDGFGLGLHAEPPYLAISTTSGAMVVELSTELPTFLGPRKPGAYAESTSLSESERRR